MTKPKKLIEVAMPVKEISAESVRDKSIRHGHISTLHLWWARRPLPVCRAVVFASLVPDPLDENCPEQFKEAIEILLGKDNDLPGDPYKPYEDIPHTVVVDKMEDNPRNRLMMFIGKFSDKYVVNERLGKKTPAKEQLHQFSLIKWDNKNNYKIIGRARKLIFVSHNAESGKSASELLAEYENLNKDIKKAEQKLYNHPNRHIEVDIVKHLEKMKDESISAFLAKMPKVFDPFAGGGAIPLEASRLGCNSYGNDINPVAHIIQKGSCEYPQKFGKPITYSKDEFIEIYGEEELKRQQAKGNLFGSKVSIPNRLIHDLNYIGFELVNSLSTLSEGLFPELNSEKKLLGYVWSIKSQCPNPSCQVIVPILSNRELCKRKQLYIDFDLIEGELVPFISNELKNYNTGPTLKSSKLLCPVCNSVSDTSYLKEQSFKGLFEPICLASIHHNGAEKIYHDVHNSTDFIDEIDLIDLDEFIPNEDMTVMSDLVAGRGWNYKKWRDLFNKRQLLILANFIKKSAAIVDKISNNPDYLKCLSIYNSLLLGKLLDYYSMFCRWAGNREEIKNVYSRQAIAMIFDSAETYPFSDMMGSLQNHINWILRYIESESSNFVYSNIKNAASGDQNQFRNYELDAVVTDPPYYDSIAYADISDYFYVWHKKMLRNKMPLNFAVPLTPKFEECTALKHHHNNSKNAASDHFESKLQDIFSVIQQQMNTQGIVSIMFAHQSTEAWTTLCNSILKSKLNLNASWSLDSEYSFTGLKQNKAFLASSVTVSCKPSLKFGIGDFKEVQYEILHVIKKEVKLLYDLGFRGADLLTACFGQAVSVFGRYESVEKADGSEVIVAELLEMAREAAFDAIISDIDTDDITKFYIGWLNLFGFSEAIHDDVRRISQIGLSVEMNEIYDRYILVKNGDKGVLGSMHTRIKADSKLGLRPVNNSEIDIAHRLMFLYDPNNASRNDLLNYISDKVPTLDSPVWRVLNSLIEILPKSKELKDQELALGLLNNQENLLREAKNNGESIGTQTSLDFE